MQPTLIILSAGMGSRYGGLKQLDTVGPNGETIMDYSVFDAARAGFGKVVFVIRKHFRSEFVKTFAKRYRDDIEIAFVEQEPEKDLPMGFTPPPDRTKPWGTAHAMLMAEPETATPFAVINADDFYGKEAYEAMSHFLRNTVISNKIKHDRYVMVGYKVGKTLSDSGGVSRGICSVNPQSILSQIVEQHNIRRIASPTDANITHPSDFSKIVYDSPEGTSIEIDPSTPVSMNFWGFTPDFFNHTRNAFHTFIREQGNEMKSECYIPTVVNHLIHTNKSHVYVLDTNASWFGVTYREDRPNVTEKIQELINMGLYPKTIIHP